MKRRHVVVHIPLFVPDDMDPDDVAFEMAALAEERGCRVGYVEVENE